MHGLALNFSYVLLEVVLHSLKGEILTVMTHIKPFYIKQNTTTKLQGLCLALLRDIYTYKHFVRATV